MPAFSFSSANGAAGFPPSRERDREGAKTKITKLMRENATKASRCSKGRYRNRLTTQYTSTANPGMMLIRNPPESKLAHCESNGKMGTPGLCPEVITAAARIKRLTQRGSENRTRETNFKPLITFSRSSRGSDRLLLMKFNELRQSDSERVRIFGSMIEPSTRLE